MAEEDEWRYSTAERRQRGGRKKKKKRLEQQLETDWDELYDPSKPTNVDEYLRSDERVREVAEWKELLYRHRRTKEDSYDSENDEGEESLSRAQNIFAPPASYAFAPPPQSPPSNPAPVTATVDVSDDATGDDAYARRLALSQNAAAAAAPPPPPPPAEATPSATISRAPVRYTQPPPPEDEVDEEDENADYRPSLGPGAGAGGGQDPPAEQPRSSRPGQAGFAQRLMSKYGWAKGSGLGADESGILNPLRVQVEKRRRKADADGGGWAEPGGKGRIIGGRKGAGAEGEAATGYGTMSEVVVLRGMLEGMESLEAEIADGLGQEIGEECGEKYGRVDRLYIDVADRQVFIKFTDQVSALRAVSELNGRIFNGNAIAARFYDAERFDRGVYR